MRLMDAKRAGPLYGPAMIPLPSRAVLGAAPISAAPSLPAAAQAAVTVSVHPKVFTNDPDATFQFTGADSYVCEVDAAASYTSCPSTYLLQGLSEGAHTIKVED